MIEERPAGSLNPGKIKAKITAFLLIPGRIKNTGWAVPRGRKEKNE